MAAFDDRAQAMTASEQTIVGLVLWTVTVVEQLVEQTLLGSAIEAVTVCVPRLYELVSGTRTNVPAGTRLVCTGVPSTLQTSSASRTNENAGTVITTTAGAQLVVTGAGQIRPTVAARMVTTVEQEAAHPLVSAIETITWLAPSGNTAVKSTWLVVPGKVAGMVLVCRRAPCIVQKTASGSPPTSDT